IAFLARWVKLLVVPCERQSVVIITVIRVPFPIAGQAEIIRSFLETAISDQLGVQAALDAAEHEFNKLPIEQRADWRLNRIGFDHDACWQRRLALASQRTEAKQYAKRLKQTAPGGTSDNPIHRLRFSLEKPGWQINARQDMQAWQLASALDGKRHRPRELAINYLIPVVQHFPLASVLADF